VVTGERTVPDGPVELVAYVVGIRSADTVALGRQLADALPPALLPGRIVAVPHIPITANGKTDLDALRAWQDDGNPGTLAVPEAQPDDWRTDTERLVAAVWCEVLGRESVGRAGKFAELGGDSFKTLAVFGRLRRHFPALGIAMLFKHPSVAELSEALDRMGEQE
jgi:hypothetical protein